MNVEIRQDRCVGCGACLRDCLRELFYVADGKAQIKQGVCIRCGHCVAVCRRMPFGCPVAGRRRFSPTTRPSLTFRRSS